MIKDIRQLELRDDVMIHAQKLIDQIEQPVVFWINAETDKNYLAPHPMNPNQYFLTIKAGTTKAERERIILHDLYKAVQKRKRYLIATPNQKYLISLGKNTARVKMLENLIGEINSFATSLECELYLEQFNITTADEIKKWKFDNYKCALLEYIQIQKKQTDYHWYRENEASNLIGFAACSRFGAAYSDWFQKNILQVMPFEDRFRYRSILQNIEKLVKETRNNYDELNGEGITNENTRQLIKIFDLDSMISLDYPNAYQTVKEINGAEKRFFSFIPDDFIDKDLILQGVRAVNECIGLCREIIGIEKKPPFAVVAISDAFENNMHAVYSEDQGMHFILIYIDFLRKLRNTIETIEQETSTKWIEQKKGKDYVLTKLFKYSLFYITLHEYGHIFFGDCTNSESKGEIASKEKENRADHFANQHIGFVLMDQYRQIDLNEFEELCRENCVFLAIVDKIISALRNVQV